MNSHYKCL